MKVFSIATALMTVLISSSSFADVKPPGTYVPQLCAKNSPSRSGNTIEIVAATSVCTGRVVGSKSSFVSVSSNDGQTRVYRVIRSEQIPTYFHRQVTAYRWELIYTGNTVRRNMLQNIEFDSRPFTVMVEVGQDGLLQKLEGRTPGNLQLHAEKFEVVYSTLGL